MPFDFKKEYKDLYFPKTEPCIVMVPTMNFIAVKGKGDPNEENGEYSKAIEVLYALSYTLKFSPKNNYYIEGYFDYVVPPLEGFWWIPGLQGMDYNRKDLLHWLAVIRLPDFVKPEDLDWAKGVVESKKKLDCAKAEFLTFEEGVCVQVMHIGAFDDEPKTIDKMHAYIDNIGYVLDFSDTRMHHEIYLSDIRKVKVENWKTVIRHPIKRK